MNLELDELYLNPAIYIARSDTHRWGVFAAEDIQANDVLQESPYCTFGKKEIKKSNVISRYTYGTCGEYDVEDYVLGFGFAAMYNHNEELSNAAYQLDTVNEVMRHYATDDIKAGDEIFIDYGCGDEWGDDDY
jgi:SET domain-containing protein